MKRKVVYVLLLLACFVQAGCIELSLPEGWKDPRNEQGNRKVAFSDFSYFAFLKEDNPSLKSDIICTSLEPYNLLMISADSVELPCELIPRFSVGDGLIFWNGDELVSGETPIYCSAKNPVQITVTGVAETTQYHSISFLPYTGLPVVVVVTDENKAIESKDIWLHAQLKTYGFGAFPDTDDSVYVKKRGNGTAVYPKVSFNVRYEKKKYMLGMPKGKRWCFLANFRDRTEIRNAVTFRMGQLADGLEWTPRSQFANVVLNGKYEGLYQIAEKISVGGNRIDIDELGSDSTDNNIGYLLEMDSYYDEVWKFRTEMNGWPVNIKSPGGELCDSSFLKYIRAFYNGFESCLEQGDFKTASERYYDMDSFIDYGLVQSLTNNGEFFNIFSVYCYKKENGKLYAGPLWDFDYRTFNDAGGALFTSGIWYRYLADDEVFVSNVKSRWDSYKSRLDPYIFNYIDSISSAISLSAHADENVYPFSKYMPEYLNGDETLSFEDAVSRMKMVLADRISNMDKLIEEL